MSQTPSSPPQNMPSLEQIVNKTRSEFYSDAGQLHDKIIKPYLIIITELTKKLMAMEESAKPKNRADRRREQRTQKKAQKEPQKKVTKKTTKK